MNQYENEKVFEKIKIDDLLVPKNNSTVKMNMYWIFNDGYVYRHKVTKAWQCNQHEQIIRDIAEAYGSEYKLFPVLYVPK